MLRRIRIHCDSVLYSTILPNYSTILLTVLALLYPEIEPFDPCDTMFYLCGTPFTLLIQPVVAHCIIYWTIIFLSTVILILQLVVLVFYLLVYYQ